MATDTPKGLVRFFDEFLGDAITLLFGEVQWRADNGGPLMLEMRVKAVTSVADGETYAGFSDATTDENPITLSTADALTTNASNAAGFTYTGGGTANWKAVSVNADADGAVIACNVGGVTTPVVGTWQTLKVVINSEGDARFFINGIDQGV